MRYGVRVIVVGSFLSVNSVFAAAVTVDMYEQTMSIADTVSVQVAGSADMTYCSLLTRINLERLTGWGSAQGFVDGFIPQGDAITLIEEGLATNQVVEFVDPFIDLQSLGGGVQPYTLFDFYIYTPHPDDTLTPTDYLLQGHRAVLLYADDMRWVLDSIRGTSLGRQPREEYTKYIDESASLFVATTTYSFVDGYEHDLVSPIHYTESFDHALSKGWVETVVDEQNMPLSYRLLSDLLFVTAGNRAIGFSGTVITSSDGTPFHLGLTQIGDEMIFTGKQLVFSQPFLFGPASMVAAGDLQALGATLSCPHDPTPSDPLPDELRVVCESK